MFRRRRTFMPESITTDEMTAAAIKDELLNLRIEQEMLRRAGESEGDCTDRIDRLLEHLLVLKHG